MAFNFTDLVPNQILDLGKPCKEYTEAVKTRKGLEIDWTDSTKALAALKYFVDLQEKADKPDTDVEEETLHAPSRDGFDIPIRIFRSAGQQTAPSPLIVMYFGGAFITGSPVFTAPLARTLVKRFNVVVASPAYRLAPEYPFPIGNNDGYDAFKWIAANATSRIRADPSKGFIVGGVSAGGNMSNVIAHLARDEGITPPITGLWLSCSGVRIAPKDAHLLPEKYTIRNLSREQEEVTRASSDGISNLAKGSLKPDMESKLYAPMIWSTDDESLGHKGFPKTYFQVCGMEPSRDEQLIFDDILKGLGVETRLDLYEGLPHAFFVPFPNLPQVKKWEEDTVDGFAWLLKG